MQERNISLKQFYYW